MTLNYNKTTLNLAKKLTLYQLIIVMLAGFLVPVSAIKAADPLTISNINIAQTDRSATISWQTNQEAYGRLDYGIASGSYHWYIQTGNKQNNHTVTIFGLNPETDYFFQITADSNTAEVASFEQTFKTEKRSDNKAPTISNVHVAYVTGGTATIQWLTDESTTSEIEYGRTTSYGSNRNSTTRTRVHDLTITGLTGNALYHFRVKSKDEDNNTATWHDMTFRVLPSTQIDNANLNIYDITPTSANDINVTETTAVISWRTNKLAQGWVRYGLTSSYGNTIATNPPRDFSQNITLTGLRPATTYYFDIQAKDVFGRQIRSNRYSFTTRGSSSGTGQVLGASYSGAGPSFYASYNSDFLPDIAQGNRGVTQTGSVSIVPGQYSQAANISFNSQLEYSGQNNFNINQGTIAFWFKPDWNSNDNIDRVLFDLKPSYNESSEKYFLIGKMTNDDQGISNELTFGLEDSDDNDYWVYVNNVGISANQWYFVTATWQYDGGDYKIYLNGQSANMSFAYNGENQSHNLKNPPNLGDNFYVGSNRQNSETNSIVDEVMIFDEVLNEEEIYQLYIEGSNFFDIDGVGGNYYYDGSNNNNTGQVLGASNIDELQTPTTVYACNPSLGYTKIKALYKTTSSPDVWAILETGQKHYITSPAVFDKYQCNWSAVRTVSQQTLNSYANANLVRTPENSTIYHLFQRPDHKWLKINIPSPTVFISYSNNYWGNVARVDVLDTQAYPDVQLIKGQNDPNIYLIEGNKKRRFSSREVFDRLGYDFAEVVELNQIHLDSYENGTVIE